MLVSEYRVTTTASLRLEDREALEATAVRAEDGLEERALRLRFADGSGVDSASERRRFVG